MIRRVVASSLLALLPLSVNAADKPKDHNARVEAALKPVAKWPGVIKTYIGVTRLGTRIPCLVTKDDADYGTKKIRILIVGGIFGSKRSVKLALKQMKWFYTHKDAAKYRKQFAVSVVPIANPDAWATYKGPGNLSGGSLKSFPPIGSFYSTSKNPEAAYLWRWIGMHAPDDVDLIVTESIAKLGHSTNLLHAIKSKSVIGVGKLMAIQGDWPTDVDVGSIAKLELKFGDHLKLLRMNRIKGLKEKHDPVSPARRELQKRIARSPVKIANQLTKKYGHNLNSVAYIPALALVGRVRIGELTGDTSHLKDVEKIVAPYFTGRKKTFGKRIGGSHLSGHLIFSELARVTKDPAKRKRFVELVLQAADLGFDRNGKPKKAMPFHNEMSDAVFMGCPILVAAGKLTGEKKYYDMALRHMRFMLKLNLRKDGLHRHSPLNETAWGRGNGFPALGLALCLTDLPQDHPGYKEMLAAFRAHMAAMAKHQDYTGTWHQVVDRPESYRELTVTCMTTFAMIRGIRNGWLDKKTYEPIVKRAWTAIKTRIAPDATLVDVCIGTGKQKSLRAYYDRKAILGHDARGGAMALMVTTEMMAWGNEQSGKRSATRGKANGKLDESRQVFKKFLKAFADANTNEMGKYYSENVIVLKGSTLLDPKYGGLPTKRGQKEDAIVKRADLLKAYQNAIRAFGGAASWKKRGTNLLKKEVRVVSINDDWLKKLKAAKIRSDIRKGDVMAIVIPKGDSLTFLLRQSKQGKWQIVAEHWD